MNAARRSSMMLMPAFGIWSNTACPTDHAEATASPRTTSAAITIVPPEAPERGGKLFDPGGHRLVQQGGLLVVVGVARVGGGVAHQRDQPQAPTLAVAGPARQVDRLVQAGFPRLRLVAPAVRDHLRQVGR